MKTKILTLLIWLIFLSLTACAPSGSANPTPTIVRLDPNAPAEVTATTATADPTATVTAIAPPSATPTDTPVSTAITVSVTPTATATAADAIVRVEVVTTAVYLRAGPGLDYEIIGGAEEGDQFAVTAVSASGDWFQIVTAGEEPGWISAQANYTRLISAAAGELPVTQTTASTAGGGEATAPTSPASALTGSGATGGGLVFTTGSGGDLYVVNADGTGLQKLAGGVIDPVVSPDGEQVAFTRWDGAEFGTLYVMNLDGSGERAVLGETRQAKSPTWSPDGREIIVSFQHGGLRDPEEECRRYKLGERIRIPGNAAITSFKWIGDKNITQVCYIPFEDLQWGLRRVNLATGQFEDLPADLYSFSPTWDPNQAWRVLYNTDKGLMQLDINTGQLQPITGDFRDKAPVFSPDGQTLALTYKQHDHWEVYTYNIAGGARQRLTKPPILADPQYNSAAPAWSPDGSHIVFVTDRRGQWEIWVMNTDGSEQHPFFSTEAQAQLGLNYQGVNERMLNWVGSSSISTATGVTPTSVAAQSSGASGEETATAANISLSGTWDFSFGTMSLAQQDTRVEGTYRWYGDADTGRIKGIVIGESGQFQGMWISDRSPNSQRLLRWQPAADGGSFSGATIGGATEQQWCGIRSGRPLPDGCGFSGTWQLRFGSPSGVTGQATLAQTGQTVQGAYVDSRGHTGQIVDGVVTVQSATEMKLTGTWRTDQGEQDSFEWRLDLTTGRTFQGRRDPGNSEWCGWRQGTSEPEQCGWE